QIYILSLHDALPIYVTFGFLQRRSRSDTTRKIGNVGGPIVGPLFEYCGVGFHGSLISAFLNMDFSVPIGRSSFQSPGTVTTIDGMDGERPGGFLFDERDATGVILAISRLPEPSW